MRIWRQPAQECTSPIQCPDTATASNMHQIARPAQPSYTLQMYIGSRSIFRLQNMPPAWQRLLSAFHRMYCYLCGWGSCGERQVLHFLYPIYIPHGKVLESKYGCWSSRCSGNACWVRAWRASDTAAMLSAKAPKTGASLGRYKNYVI